MTAFMTTGAPRIEVLLDRAHRALDATLAQRATLIRCGIAADHLPDDTTLIAFALLGEHARDQVADQARPEWDALQQKGLVRGALESMPTPQLRLLVHALPLTAVIDTLWQRLTNAVDAPDATPGRFQCVRRVQGEWGRIARIYFAADDVSHVLISPDPIFRLQPSLLAAPPIGRCVGVVSVPIDEGRLTFTIRWRDESIARHVVELGIREMRT